MAIQRLPEELPLRLGPYRLLPLSDDRLAVLASQHTGWALLSKADWPNLLGFLARGPRADRVSPEERGTLQALWEAGLLTAGGVPNPDTKPEISRIPTSLLIKLTGSCNYECDYCYDYDSKRWRAQLDLPRIRDVVGQILDHGGNLTLVFHGGEPLLRFKTLRAAVEEFTSLHDRTRLRFAIQTNAALLDAEKRAFLEKHDFSVGISLDGMTEEANALRRVHGPRSALGHFLALLGEAPEFVRERCGILAVASRRSLDALPAFAVWLQERSIASLSISFLDLTGRAEGLASEKPSPEQAVGLYKELLSRIDRGSIREIALRSLTSRMSNIFTFRPRDFCHKGPCAAAGDFLVLDASGGLRSCDCIYHEFFELGGPTDGLDDVLAAPARAAVVDRHSGLGRSGPLCSTCPVFGLCGGTCVAKAISANGRPDTVDPIECALSQYLYPKLLADFDRAPDGALFEYYNRHRVH